MEKNQMDADELDRLLDTQGNEKFPEALGDRIMARLPAQSGHGTRPLARVVAFGGSIAASLAIGISLGLSDIGLDDEYAEEDMMALAFGLTDEEDQSLVGEN